MNERVGKSGRICKNCHNSILDRLCPTDLMLISQIISFTIIVAEKKVAQHGLEEQCILTMRSTRFLLL